MEQLLLDTLHSKDEIDAFLKNKINTKLVHASGAYKILENMTFAHENDAVNYDSLLKLVDKRIENEMPKTLKKKDLIHEITRNIFSKVQSAQKKKIKDNNMFSMDYYQKKFQKIDLDMITVEKEVQTEDEEAAFRRKSMAVRNMLKNKEIDNYTKDLEAYNDEVLRKCYAIETQKNSLENDNNDLYMQVKQLQLRVKVKKEKTGNLKQLIKELREKLNELSEKEANNLMLFKNKEKECEKILVKNEETHQMLNNQLKEMTTKHEFLEKRLKEANLIRLNSKFEGNSSPSMSPLHRLDSKVTIEGESQKSNQNIKEKEKTRKKQSIKRKRASTVDTKLLNRLVQKSSNDENDKITENKSTPRKISEKPENREKMRNMSDNRERMSAMKRSRSLFVANPQKMSFSKGLHKPDLPSSKERTSLPRSVTVTISKSYIDSSSSEKKLETLEENSNDSNIEAPISPIIEASFEKDSVILDNKVDNRAFFLSENVSVDLKDFAEKRPKTQTQEMACDVRPEQKEQESTAFFVDQTELYLKKLQKMVDQNNVNIRYILERVFLNRNHKTFIEELVMFLRKGNLKKVDRFTQTEDFSLSIKPLSQKIVHKPSEKKIINQSIKNEGFMTKREDVSEFYDNFQENPDVNKTKTQKSQSQHISSSSLGFLEKRNRKNSQNPIKDQNYQMILNEKLNKTEKPQIPASFLFNKAINGDLFRDLNRTSSQERIKLNKNNLEGFSRQPPLYEEYLMKIDINQEKEEDLEREKLIKRLSQHIQDMKVKNVENFAKIKHLFKYPFKTVREFVGNEPEVGIDDGRIEELVTKFVNKHRFCGGNCEHLKRFYQRIGFINIQMNRKEAILHKHFINKLPNLEENA